MAASEPVAREGQPPFSVGDERALRYSVAFIWLITGLLVLHPQYQQVGARHLAALGLPSSLMWATCAGEVLLGIYLLRRPMARWVIYLQMAAILAFSVILAVYEPSYLVHPFGILTKNLPILAILLTLRWGRVEGWSPRVMWLLRVGVALPWLTEGLFPKILFQQVRELELVASSPFSWGDPALFLRVIGAIEILSFLLALLARGALLRAVLLAQAAGLVLLPLLVTLEIPLIWVHPFGPLTKNVPLLIGTLAVWRRCTR